jgi:hypothetical protein
VPKQCPEAGIFARHRNNRTYRSNRHRSNERVLIKSLPKTILHPCSPCFSCPRAETLRSGVASGQRFGTLGGSSIPRPSLPPASSIQPVYVSSRSLQPPPPESSGLALSAQQRRRRRFNGLPVSVSVSARIPPLRPSRRTNHHQCSDRPVYMFPTLALLEFLTPHRWRPQYRVSI